MGIFGCIVGKCRCIWGWWYVWMYNVGIWGHMQVFDGFMGVYVDV